MSGMNMSFLREINDPSMDPPPPYTPSDTPTMPDAEQDTKQPLPPPSTTSQTPSTSTQSQPHRIGSGIGIQVPSKHSYFTSGFAYPPFLAHYAITPHHWTQFTHDLNEEVKLSPRQWATTIAKGAAVLALGGMVAGVLGAIPAVVVAQKARRNREEMNLVIASSSSSPEGPPEGPAEPDTDSASGAEGRQGRLSRKIERWNETFFRPRGVVVRVDLPWEEMEEMAAMEVFPAGRFGFGSRRDEEALREDAARKARIVVIPVDTGSGSASASGSFVD